MVGIGGLNIDPYLALPDVGRVRHLYVLRKCRGRGAGKKKGFIRPVTYWRLCNKNKLMLKTLGIYETSWISGIRSVCGINHA